MERALAIAARDGSDDRFEDAIGLIRIQRLTLAQIGQETSSALFGAVTSPPA
jgi:hypothetical protein